MPKPDEGGRWGILGGAFDPPHIGHIALAAEVANLKKLDGVLMVPSYVHPFKKQKTVASFADRTAMLRLACSENELLVISEVEAELEPPGYSLDLIMLLKKRYSNVNWHFIIGADNCKEIDSWHHPEELLRQVTVLIGSRPGQNQGSLPDIFDGRVEYLSTAMIDISSTTLRSSLSESVDPETASRYLHPAVASYINEKGLYQ